MMISGSIVLYKTVLSEVLHVIKCFLDNEKVGKLFVIDNSPEDLISQHLYFDKRIEYAHFPENLGYGKAHNQGLQKAIILSKYHVVLNTDLSFNSNCIEELYNFMERRADVGLVMPKIIYPEGTIQTLVRDNPTPYLLFVRRFFKGNEKAKNAFKLYENKDKDYDKPMYHIPFLSGCFMFLRTTSLQKSGLFDEKIFMYTEDADLTRRILQVAETAYWPNAVAIHDFKGGVHKSKKLTWFGFKSAFYYFNKWGWKNNLKREVLQ